MFVEELIAEIVQMEQDKPTPFPYPDCRFVLKGVEHIFESFIPDLDLWSLGIAGYCSWGMKMLRWSQAKLLEAQSRMALGFFEAHPDYCMLQRTITESEVPNLYAYMGAYEGMRRKLLEVFSCLLVGSERNGP